MVRLPCHKCSLHIEHNPHTDYYESVAEHLKGIDEGSFVISFRDDESRQRCIDTGELWTLQWYPDTPVGCVCVAAPTLAELVAFACDGTDSKEWET